MRLKDLLRTFEQQHDPPPTALRPLRTSPTVSSRLFDMENSKPNECVSLFKKFYEKLFNPSQDLTRIITTAEDLSSVQHVWSPFTSWGCGHPAVPIVVLVSIEDEPALQKFIDYLESKLNEYLYETVVYTPARTHRDSLKGVISFSTHATEVAELVTEPEFRSAMTNFGFRNNTGVKPGIIWKIYVNADESLLESVKDANTSLTGRNPERINLFFARMHALWITNHYADLSARSVIEEAKRAKDIDLNSLRESFNLPEKDAMGAPFTIDTIIGAVISRRRRFNRPKTRK